MHPSHRLPSALIVLVGSALWLSCLPAVPPGPGGNPDGAGDGDHSDEPRGQCPGGDAAFEMLLAELTASVEGQGGPGAAIAVVCDGKLAHAAGIGSINAGGPPITADTRFQLASVTKMFTGALGVALAESGQLDLSEPISRHLPSLRYGSISLHQLLTHTAGYPTDFTDSGSTLVELAQANATLPMWSPPGAVWNYSNPGFAIAGAVMEKATATPFDELVQEHVFIPAGMTTARMKVPVILAEGNFAYGHSGSQAQPEMVAPDGAYFETTSYGPMGGAWGSVKDLARWGQAHIAQTDGPLSSTGFDRLRAAHTRTGQGSHYGYGLFVDPDASPELVYHGGSTVGFLADWTIVPSEGFGVFVVTNSEWVDPTELSQTALDRYLSISFDSEPAGTEADYVGTYEDPNVLGTVTVSVDNGALSATIGGQQQPMTYVYGDTFSLFSPFQGEEIYVNFWRDPGQRADYIVSLWGVARRAQ